MIVTVSSAPPQWVKFSTAGSHSRLALEFHCAGDCTLFALRKVGLEHEVQKRGD